MKGTYFYLPGTDDLEAVVPATGEERAYGVSAQEAYEPDRDFPDNSVIAEAIGSNRRFLDMLSTHFLICNEKIPGHGEDSGFESYTFETGIVGVFDGCGGLGSKTCELISDKTEAYIASRAVCSAARMWFLANCEYDSGWDMNELKDSIVINLAICQKAAGAAAIRFRGTMIRSFPTTLAMVVFRTLGNKLYSDHIWAGDSRTYIIDECGLGQVSTDDVKGEDAFITLTRDSALTNVISSDAGFRLHKSRHRLSGPCIVLAASDGSFGYVSSPMEYELMILSSLICSLNVDEWQRKLDEEISERAGDDQTIAVAAFGFNSFSEMKDFFFDRYRKVLRIVREFNTSGESEKQRLWEIYKPNYYRYAAREM